MTYYSSYYNIMIITSKKEKVRGKSLRVSSLVFNGCCFVAFRSFCHVCPEGYSSTATVGETLSVVSPRGCTWLKDLRLWCNLRLRTVTGYSSYTEYCIPLHSSSWSYIINSKFCGVWGEWCLSPIRLSKLFSDISHFGGDSRSLQVSSYDLSREYVCGASLRELPTLSSPGTHKKSNIEHQEGPVRVNVSTEESELFWELPIRACIAVSVAYLWREVWTRIRCCSDWLEYMYRGYIICVRNLFVVTRQMNSS
jgi:hypothetical protein